MRHTLAMLVCAAVATAAVLPSPANAADLVPFAISEHIDFTADPVVATFTATGPLCASGTFDDSVDVVAAAPNPTRAELLIRTVYTCDDGSGTFNMQKHVFITLGTVANTSTGPVSVQGGTGAYVNVRGFGVDNGTASHVTGQGVGLITGDIVQR